MPFIRPSITDFFQREPTIANTSTKTGETAHDANAGPERPKQDAAQYIPAAASVQIKANRRVDVAEFKRLV